MQTAKKFQEILPSDVSTLLRERYFSLISNFYETQSSFLSGIYKRYGSIETANIVLCFIRNMHLEIIRQREKNLNFNISLENFWVNMHDSPKPLEKITIIAQLTAIPKETVRRKINNLLDSGLLMNKKNSKGYSLNISINDKDIYFNIINEEIKLVSKFIVKLANHLKLNLNMKLIEQEIKSQFSFYWYHFLSCQLEWLKIWQMKLKDNDLLLISLQTIIPTLQYAERNRKNINIDNIFKSIGKTADNYNVSETAVSATAVSEVTGIPRATCIRKLEKLVRSGFLLRETKSKRYFVNQNIESKTKNMIARENINSTINTFSQYLAYILNSLVQNRK